MNGYGGYGYVYNDMIPFNQSTFNKIDAYNSNNNQRPNNNLNMTQNIENTSSNMNNLMKMRNFASPYEGYIRGNIFNDLYDQYKNYRPVKLVANNEQEEMLLNLDQLCFYAHELRLYLDNYPNDSEIIGLFNNYQQKANDALYNYEQIYGPISWNALSNMDSFGWENTTWPWEMEVM